MSLADLLSAPLTDVTSPLSGGIAPFRFPVAIAGRGYLVDLNQMKREPLPYVREQGDTSTEFGAQTLSPFDLWHRDITDWSFGAGQEWLDLVDSDRRRFRSSKGIDVWTKGKFTLLPEVILKRSSASTNLRAITAGIYAYFSKGTVLEFSSDLTAWTDSVIHNGEAATTVQSIASDGFYVYAALGVNGVHRTQRGAVSSSHYSDLQATLLGYVKGRLMGAIANALYNITASGASPAALYTHPNTDFTWVAFAEGPAFLYAAGYSGDKSLIYKTAVKADGTALDIPVVAGDLPDGEIVRSMRGYLGFLLVGTDNGTRLGKFESNGDITFGARIPTSSPVLCFEPQGPHVWAGWTNYDAFSTGLMRLDLRYLVEGDAPAHATDLMAGDSITAVQGDVLSVVTFADKRLFAVAGVGLYYEDTEKVAEGTLRSGLMAYGLSGNKTYKYIDVSHVPLPAGSKVGHQLEINHGTDLSVYSEQVAHVGPTHRYDIGSRQGQVSEIVITLKRGADTTEAPAITLLTLRALPVVPRGEQIALPIELKEKVTDLTGQDHKINPQREFGILKVLERDGVPVNIQIALEAFEAFIDTVQWGQGLSLTKDKTSLQGQCIVTLRRFDT